jgi:hypothetical protein
VQEVHRAEREQEVPCQEQERNPVHPRVSSTLRRRLSSVPCDRRGLDARPRTIPPAPCCPDGGNGPQDHRQVILQAFTEDVNKLCNHKEPSASYANIALLGLHTDVNLESRKTVIPSVSPGCWWTNPQTRRSVDSTSYDAGRSRPIHATTLPPTEKILSMRIRLSLTSFTLSSIFRTI